jgi:hypothetical protein
MSLYNLYKINLNLDLVTAIEKGDQNPRDSIKAALVNHIEGIMEHETSEDSLTFSKITSVNDLPFEWHDYMLPYHKHKKDPDSLRGSTISDILESNKAQEHNPVVSHLMNSGFLFNKISELEEQVKLLKQLLQ